MVHILRFKTDVECDWKGLFGEVKIDLFEIELG